MNTIHPGADLSTVRLMVADVFDSYEATLGSDKTEELVAHLTGSVADDVVYSPGDHWGWDSEAKVRVLQEVESAYFEGLIRAETEKFLSGEWKVLLFGNFCSDSYELVGTFPDAGSALLVGINRCEKTFAEVVELDGSSVSEFEFKGSRNRPDMVSIFQYDEDGVPTNEYVVFL